MTIRLTPVPRGTLVEQEEFSPSPWWLSLIIWLIRTLGRSTGPEPLACLKAAVEGQQMSVENRDSGVH